MHIFVGNLSSLTTREHLSRLFIKFGKVLSVKIETNTSTGHSLGFGYVEMDNIPGSIAIRELDSRNFMNHYLEVIEAEA